MPKNFPILEHFAYDHLPPHLAEVSRPFCEMAEWVASLSGDNAASAAEAAAGLRKLLEAKDCTVRAVRVARK